MAINDIQKEGNLVLWYCGALDNHCSACNVKDDKVNSTDDIVANDGNCTLREAVIAANTDTASGSLDGECPAGKGVDTIKLKSGEYKFMITGTGEDNAQTGDLDILDDLTIKGKGAEKTLINANNIE
jgi:CSLREA domain-containing protein